MPEITAIPKLLKVLSISGCLITIDAMGCQKEIVKQITEQQADYVITLKKNQGYFYQRVEKLLNKLSKNTGKESTQSNYYKPELSHGRQEYRYYYMASNIAKQVDPFGEWKNLKSIGFVDYFRSEKDGKRTCERRYYISSLSNNAEILAEAIRGHWGIENQLNWVMDVQFPEDNSRIRTDNAPENLAVIRQIALNLLNQEKAVKTGIKNKRKRAGWNNNYLLKVLFSSE